VLVAELPGGRTVHTLRGHTASAVTVAFSPDGRRLASGSIAEAPAAGAGDGRVGEVIVWDLDSGRPAFTGRGHRGGVGNLAFSPDGRLLASSGGAPMDPHPADVVLRDAPTGRDVRTLTTGPGAVGGLAFSPDGRLLAAAQVFYRTPRGEVRVWEVATGEPRPPFRGHDRGVSDLRFSPDSRRLATASLDQTAKVWDVAAREPILTLSGHAGAVTGVRFSPDGQRLATGGTDRTARVWDAATGRELLTFRGHTGALGPPEFTPDGRLLVTVGQKLPEGDGRVEVKVWDAATAPDALARPAHQGGVFSLAYGADGRHLATAGYDGAVRVWDVADLRPVRTLRGTPGESNAVALSPDGRLVAARGMGSVLRLWELTTGKEVLTLPGFGGPLRAVAVSPDGRFVVTDVGRPQDLAPGDVRVWELATRRVVHHRRGRGVAFSPDGQLLAVGGNGNVITLVDLADGRETRTLAGHEGVVAGLAFSADGRRLASASWDTTVRVWDMATGRSVQTLRGHSGPVWTVSFGPDGRRLASASMSWSQLGQGEVKVWDVATGRDALTLAGNAAAAFSPDGRKLAALDMDFFLPSRLKLFDAGAPTPGDQAARRAAVLGSLPAWHRESADECFAAGQWPAAEFHLGRALAARPDDWPLCGRRGFARAAQGRWAEAAADYDQVLDHGAGDRRTWYRRALLALALDDRDGYRRLCDRAVKRFGEATDPDFAVIVPWVCKLAAGAVDDYAVPVRCAERAVAARPDSVDLLNHLGGILLRAGRAEVAVRRLEEASRLRRDGFDVWEWVWLALAHQRLGHADEARRWLERAALRIDSEAAESLAWDARLELQLLRREAERLIGPGGAGERR
jgi:WD40 repeat protein